MIPDVVLEQFRADDFLAIAPVGKDQKGPVVPELIRDTFGTARMLVRYSKSTEVVWKGTHSSGLLACALSVFISTETEEE